MNSGSHTSSLMAPVRSNGEGRFVLAGLASRRCSTSAENCGEGPEIFIKVSRFNKFLDESLTNWSTWSEWSECDKSCGDGKKHRVRMCESYSNARKCEGLSHESKYCRVKMCPQITGPWNEWSDCSKPCGGGSRWRKKKCEPIDLCYDLVKARQDESCNTSPCESSWSWSDWSGCSCSSTKMTREYPYCFYKGKIVTEEMCFSAGPKPKKIIQSRPCEKPTNPATCHLLITGGMIDGGIVLQDSLLTPFFLTMNDDDICSAAVRKVKKLLITNRQ